MVAGRTKKNDKKNMTSCTGETGIVTPTMNRCMEHRPYMCDADKPPDKATFEIIACGMILVYFTRAYENSEPFIQPFYQSFKENEQLKLNLRVLGSFVRRGDDGEIIRQKKGSKYPWKCLLLLPEESETLKGEFSVKNPPVEVTMLINYFNSDENKSKFQYKPSNVVVKTNETQKCRRPLDRIIMEKDVVKVMEYLFPGDKGMMSKYDSKTLGMFWNDISHGRKCMPDYNGDDDEDNEDDV